MQLTPGQAEFLLQIEASALEKEHAITAKVLRAIPADKADYKPDANSMTAFDLAWHIAASSNRFLSALPTGEFVFSPLEKVKTMEDLVDFYDTSFQQDIAAIKAMTGEQLAKVMDFMGILKLPAVMYLAFCSKHEIHHRGQLSTYLRPMGAKVPSIYGESYDAKQERQAAAQ